jgi:class 3 adenylate cyclase
VKTLAELQESITSIFKTAWPTPIRQGTQVPEAENVKLGNDAVELDGTVLYADLVDSTGLVLGFKDWFAAEVHKAYLLTASELIRNNGGSITSFDGDRVMGVFIGDHKNSSAAKCALQINYMVTQEINPRLKARYPNTTYAVRQAIGIDTSKLFVAKTGVRGANDLVWIGRAANYAAKLCAVRDVAAASYITGDVYGRLRDDCKYAGSGSERKNMWTKFTWAENGTTAYCSSWHWKP